MYLGIVRYFCFMQKIRFVLNYINYLFQSSNKYDIHPPFLYNLITKVFEDKKQHPEYLPIESLKKTLLQNRERIQVTDLGAGSTADSGTIRTIHSLAKHSSKPKKFGRLLFRLARELEPTTILELGTAMGISSAYLASACPTAAVTTIEGCENIAGYARKNFTALELENIRVLNGNFDALLPAYLRSVDQLDLAFIDGNHREGPTINYFEQCLSKTVNTSCIVFDDIHWSKGMEKAWETICKHEAVTLSLDLYFVGIVFFRKELSKQHFLIRF